MGQERYIFFFLTPKSCKQKSLFLHQHSRRNIKKSVSSSLQYCALFCKVVLPCCASPIFKKLKTLNYLVVCRFYVVTYRVEELHVTLANGRRGGAYQFYLLYEGFQMNLSKCSTVPAMHLKPVRASVLSAAQLLVTSIKLLRFPPSSYFPCLPR